MNARSLIYELIEMTKEHLNEAEALKAFSEEQLNKKASEESWSALECLEHLNLYGDFYIPEIDSVIKASNHAAVEKFKTGMLGNYFAKSMMPKEKLNKMKTFKDKNPNGSKLDKSIIDRFIQQQHQMLDLLNRAQEVNLTKLKTGITISNWIKLRLGDTFRVVIYHNKRHILQAKRAFGLTPS